MQLDPGPGISLRGQPPIATVPIFDPAALMNILKNLSCSGGTLADTYVWMKTYQSRLLNCDSRLWPIDNIVFTENIKKDFIVVLNVI